MCSSASCMLGLQVGVTTPGSDSLREEGFLTYKQGKLKMCKGKSCLAHVLIGSTGDQARASCCQAEAHPHHSVIPTPSPPLTPLYQQESKTTAMVNLAQVIVLSVDNRSHISFDSDNMNEFSRDFPSCSPLSALEIHKHMFI